MIIYVKHIVYVLLLLLVSTDFFIRRF